MLFIRHFALDASDQPTEKREKTHRLTVGLLESGTGRRSSELLGLAATGVGNEQSTVIGEENVLNFLLGGLIDV